MTETERPWIDGLTFEQVLTRTVERFGDLEAVVFPELGHRRTYRELQADVREAARAFMALDIQPGEHIGIWATNWPQWVVTQFATAHM